MNSLRNPLFALVCLVLIPLVNSTETLAQQPTLVSVAAGDVRSGGTQSIEPVVSANGRIVAFESSAFNLVPNDNNGSSDIFVRDLQTGTTTLVSINLAGTGSGNGHSTKPTISADGRYVAFQSRANNLVANDTNTWSDVFVRDLQTGATRLLSTNSAGTGSGNEASEKAVISANGKTVVFQSLASNIVSFDNTNRLDVFAHDVPTGVTRIVSCDVTCTAPGNNDSYTGNVPKDKAPRAIISKDGRFVVFESMATNLVTTTDANGSQDIFVRDLETNVTSVISMNSTNTAASNGGGSSPVISGNGRFVFFQSAGTDIAANDTAFPGNDLFVRDRETNTSKLVSVTTTNTGSNIHGGTSFFPVSSDDGRYVTFQSDANTYVNDDTDSTTDVFRRDLQTETTTLISLNSNAPSLNISAAGAVMSADGRFVAFFGFGPGWSSTPDNNNRSDVFVRDVNAGTTTCISMKLDGTSTANFGGEYPVISADGRVVLFESSATDMVPNQVLAINTFAAAFNSRTKFQVSTLTVAEGVGQTSLAVTRTGNTSDALTVQYTTNSGTATAPADFTSVSGSLSFAAGETTKNVVVPIINDSLDEDDESLMVIVSDFDAGSSSATLTSAIVTIVDDDSPPSLNVNDVSVSEGNAGSTIVSFTLTLSVPSGRPLSVTGSVSGGTAVPGSDFIGFTNTLTFAPGETSKQFSLQVFGDRMFEDDETVLLSLGGPINVTLVRTEAVLTLLNDDPQPTISISDRSLSEGDSQFGQLFFVVTLTNPTSKTVTVDFATADGTATAGADYTAVNGTLTFVPGATVAFFTVNLNNEALVETNETLFANLSNASGAPIADAQAVGTILNDDFPVLLTEEGSPDAAAFETTQWLRGPFPLLRPFNFGPDLHTRVSIFALQLDLLPGETKSAVTVSAEDEFGITHSVPVEYVGPIAGTVGLSQVIVRLPDTVGNAHELRLKLTLRGQSSNVAAIKIAQ
jgi:hypothetical protein